MFSSLTLIFLAGGDFNKWKNSADIAILLFVGAEWSGICGEAAHINPLESDQHIAAVRKYCFGPTFTFAHEIGHLFGCLHNREVYDSPTTAHGFLMRPPVNSGYCTIMR